MERFFIWAASLYCLFLGPSLAAQAPFPTGFDGELYMAPRIDMVPAAEGGPYTVTLDGVLNEPVWQRAAFHTVVTVLPTNQPLNIDPPSEDWNMIYAVAADQDFLYVAWKIVDDAVVVNQEVGCNVWQDDSIEVYIDALNNGPNCTSGSTSCYENDDAQLTIGADQITNEPGHPDQPDCPDGTPVEECLKFGGVAGIGGGCDFGPPAPELVTGVVKELQTGDIPGGFGEGLTGWQAEIAIALETLGNADDGDPAWSIVPDPGVCIGWSMQGNDDDDDTVVGRDHKLAWAKREIDESAWRNPGVFGKLTFIDPTKPASQGACALPVERLTCRRNTDGTVAVNWANPGTANPAIPIRIQVDGVEKATVAGDAVTATLTEADVPSDGQDHIITVINNSDELPPTCTLIQNPFADCGGIRFWNLLGAFDQPFGALPTDDQIRLDYMTDGITGELDFEWKLGAQIHTAFGADAASTGIRRGIGLPPKNPGNVPTVFQWQDLDSRVSFNDVFRQDINNTMAYAQVYVDNTTGDPMDVYMGISSDDSVQVYLNGNEAWIHGIPRGGADVCVPQDTSPDGILFTEPHVLEPGLNSVILKVFDGDGGWEFAFRFQDDVGEPITEGLEILFEPPVPVGPVFHRGDSDDNGALQLTDAVRVLGFLFLGNAAPPCLDAADADDNGGLQLTDAVRILGFLFLGQTAPAPPGPPSEPCGMDPTEDELDCESYTNC